MNKLENFPDVIERVGSEQKSLLIGNGFSIRHFSYADLLQHSRLEEDEPARRLFNELNTVDFERVIRALEASAEVASAYSYKEEAEKFLLDSKRVREALVHSIRNTHPKHKEEIAKTFDICCAFLMNFSCIFTLNYDLLNYWLSLEAKAFNDGFGLGEEEDGFISPFKEGAYCNIYNLHGGLHLFQNEDGSTAKRKMINSGIIDAIAETIVGTGRLPLYVAEGTSDAKYRKIRSIPYLSHCYETLLNRTGAIFIYGNAAKENDAHIYRALFGGKISHIYFCVHIPTTDLSELDGQLSHWQKSSKSKIEYSFIDSSTAPVWPS